MEKSLIETAVPKESYLEGGRLNLNAETLQLLAWFGALYWSTDDIADWFGVTDLAWWQSEVGNRFSIISRAIRKGELEKRASVELRILQGAMAGNEDDVATYRTMMRDKSFALSKLDLFGGADDELLWQRIQDYIAGGSSGTLSLREQNYLDLLNLIFSLDGRYGKRKVIQFLIKEPFGYSHAQASNLWSEAVELFHCNRKISREALRDKTAEMFDTLYHAAVEAAKTTSDFLAAADILSRKAKVLRLDQEEVPKLDPAVYWRQPVILSLDAASIGMQRADRNQLAKVVDKLGLPVGEKNRLLVEMGHVDMDVEKYLEHESQEAGNR